VGKKHARGAKQAFQPSKKICPEDGSAEIKLDEDACSLSEIYPRLFLGRVEVAKNSSWLTANGVKLVVNVSTERYDPVPGITYYNAPLKDTLDEERLKERFDEVKTQLGTVAVNDGVLIHCRSGINR